MLIHFQLMNYHNALPLPLQCNRCNVFQQTAGGRSNFTLWLSVCVCVCGVFKLVSLSRHLSVSAIVFELKRGPDRQKWDE